LEDNSYLDIRKEEYMRHPGRNGLIWISIFTFVTLSLLSCAAKNKSTQPGEEPAPTAATKEEQTKPEARPEPKAEVKPAPGVSAKEAPPSSPPPPATKPATSPAPAPQVAGEPAERTTEIALSLVNLRERPSMSDKILRVLRKGTKLIVLEEKLGWLHVRLEDGVEGWVAKSMTLEGAQPSPAAPPKGQK
jgi:uncharacterized protein YgiM (DUF1202 family)